MNTVVKDIMAKEIITINPFCSVAKAQNVLEKEKIGCLPVIEDNKLLGIITSFDIRRTHPNRLVIDAMTKNVITISERESIINALNIIEKNNIERLVVVNEKNELIGLITKGILLKEAGKRIDLLTGLQTNQSILINTAQRLANSDKDIVCLFFDLNEFGIFNKNFGHIVGDQILQRISKILKTFIQIDYLCRFGGDEFLAILPINLEDALKITSKIIEYIKADNYLQELQVSIAVGLSSRNKNCLQGLENDISQDIKSLINLASLASTDAKRLKRDYSIAEQLI